MGYVHLGASKNGGVAPAIPRQNRPPTSYRQQVESYYPRIDPAQVVQDLGFNSPIPRITAPRINAARVAIPGGTWDAYQDSLFEGAFMPVDRALGLAHQASDGFLNSNLANAGLADSGTGIAQRAGLAAQYDEQRFAAAQQAATYATSTRSAAEIAVAQQNAQFRQQARLTEAGFKYDAQVQNAQNILQGRAMKADAYLKALGISAEMAQSMANNFVNLIGLDIQQQDADTRAASMLFEQKLREAAARGEAMGGGGASIGGGTRYSGSPAIYNVWSGANAGRGVADMYSPTASIGRGGIGAAQSGPGRAVSGDTGRYYGAGLGWT